MTRKLGTRGKKLSSMALPDEKRDTFCKRPSAALFEGQCQFFIIGKIRNNECRVSRALRRPRKEKPEDRSRVT